MNADDHDVFTPDPVDRALAELAQFAVARLATEMSSAKQPKDRIAAANSILDRLGYGRTTRAQADVADKEIRRALEAAAQEVFPDRSQSSQSNQSSIEQGPALHPVDGLPDDKETDRWLLN